MTDDYRIRMEEILLSTEKVLRYTAGMSLEEFTIDEKTVDAVIRNLEMIGNAIKKVPNEVRSAHSEVDWSRFEKLELIFGHPQFGVDLVIVWDVVENRLPPLQEHIRGLLEA